MMTQIAVNTLAFNGYPIQVALEEIAKLGVEFLEPAFLTHYDPGLKEEFFTWKNAQILLNRVENLGLKVKSVASHMDMGRRDSVGIFQKRMEFARMIGSEIIITNTSHKDNEIQFYQNMRELSDKAEQLGIIIGLENPGDGSDFILSDAVSGVIVLERIGSEQVKLNYDFSNIFTLTRGNVQYEETFCDAIPYIAHLHLKNIKHQNNQWPVCNLEEGIIRYINLFARYPQLSGIPISIELPVGFGYSRDFEFISFKREVPPLEVICKRLSESVNFLKDQVFRQLPDCSYGSN